VVANSGCKTSNFSISEQTDDHEQRA
jgi:hypothetical protein